MPQDCGMLVVSEDAKLKVRQALAWRDQQIAALFVESDWTQQKIADYLGKNQSWVARRLLFGRFCNFLMPIGIKKLPVNLSEGRFRELWEQVGKGDGRVGASTPAETKRFKAILQTEEWQFQLADATPFPVSDMLKEHCCNRKWMTAEELADSISEAVDFDTPGNLCERVAYTVNRIKSSNTGGMMVTQKTFAGGVVKHKLQQVSNPEALKTRAVTIVSELAPIMEEIHMALQQRNTQDVVGLVKPQIKRLDGILKKYR